MRCPSRSTRTLNTSIWSFGHLVIWSSLINWHIGQLKGMERSMLKLGIVVEEAEESVYWLELVVRAHTVGGDDVPVLRSEASELRAIFSKSLGTARANRRSAPAQASRGAIGNIARSPNDDQITR
jgi:hypothetical protein